MISSASPPYRGALTFALSVKRFCCPETVSIRERIIKMQEVGLQLTLAEVNQILAGLGEKSYKDVFQLVSKIQAQASAQLDVSPVQADSAEG